MPLIRNLSLEEIKDYIKAHELPAFRAKQIYEWLAKGADGFDEMTNLPLSLRQQLQHDFSAALPTIMRKYTSVQDGTVKYVLSMEDGGCIETVVMRYHYGLSICISSQMGCRMGCSFCASTLHGKVRDLTAGEMLGQICRAERDLNTRISHVVIMGIGEPFDNIDNVLKFLRLATDPLGLGISARHITVSTCGLPGGIQKLTNAKIPVTLAISLHAADDETRKKLMPAARAITIAQLLLDADAYARQTGRRYTLEYALVAGVNDRIDEAKKLCRLLKGRLCHINLIPVNPVKETKMTAPNHEKIKAFLAVLQKEGVAATVRRELGRDIAASCGQLRNEVMTT